MERIFDAVEIPDFDTFLRTPRSTTCKPLDVNRIVVEILWWVKSASDEFLESSYPNSTIIGWENAIMLRYRREADESVRPTICLAFDVNEEWNIVVKQIQGTLDKKVAFRFWSSFDSVWYFMKLIDESFIKKWIRVELENIPEGLEAASNSSRASEMYEVVRRKFETLNTSIL